MFEFAEKLARYRLDGTEIQLLFCIIRHAWPYKKPYADLRWSFIRNFTGLQDGTLSKARDKLVLRNIIKTFPQESKRLVRYRINSKVGTWKTLSHRKVLSSRKANTFPLESIPYKKNIKKNTGAHARVSLKGGKKNFKR